MNFFLPPKRFEDYHDPKFDSIRHHPWFRKLAARRAKIPQLRSAANALWDNRSDKSYTQKVAAEEYGVDERELRDYLNFIHAPKVMNPASIEASVLNVAYQGYLAAGCNEPFRKYLQSSANLYGLNPRHIIEKWEVDPGFWPAGVNQ